MRNNPLDANAVAVLCSRYESRRLPGKSLLPLGGRTALSHCLIRLLKIGVPVILACPERDSDLYADEFAVLQHDIENPNIYGDASLWLHIGQSESPLHRTAAALKSFPNAEWVIRATHDDPLIDVECAKGLLNAARESSGGYGITRGIVEGAGIEVISRERLDWAAMRYTAPSEYISYFVKGPNGPNPIRFDTIAPENLRRPYRLTLDYQEDYLLLDALLTKLGPDATPEQVCRFLDRNPELAVTNQLPRVSFYTCAHNAERFIGDTIRSVVTSGMDGSSEYIILDDGSTDGTAMEVLRWIGRLNNPPWMKFIRRRENLGLAHSSNEVVSMARGRYVMRVDADDMLVPGAVPEMLQAADASRADVVYSGYQEVEEDGATERGGPRENREHHAGCALMLRSFIDEARFKSGIRLGDSKELWDRIEETAGVVIRPEVGWFYRKHARSLTWKPE